MADLDVAAKVLLQEVPDAFVRLTRSHAGRVEGRVEGQRHTLCLLIRGRLGGSCEAFAARVAEATQSTCDEATLLFGGSRSDAELLEALDALLPPAE